MKYVTHYGELWKMSDLSYLRMLRALAKGEPSPTWKELRATRIGHVALDVTDLGQQTARCHLAELVDGSGQPRKKVFVNSAGSRGRPQRGGGNDVRREINTSGTGQEG